jgi:hypothetical protein
MNENFLENSINFQFWKLVLNKYSDWVLAIYADHTFRYYPAGYFVRAFLKKPLQEKMKSNIELELKYLVMQNTGLNQQKIIVRFYYDLDIIELG